MTWRDAAVLGLLVAGAVIAGVCHLESLSHTLAGAAAGMLVPSGRIREVAPLAGAVLACSLLP